MSEGKKNIIGMLLEEYDIKSAKDFEDALQYFSAVQAGADCIVTRNIKDFDFSTIKVLTPNEFLAQYMN